MRVWTRVWRAVCRADLYAVRALRVTSERMEGGGTWTGAKQERGKEEGKGGGEGGGLGGDE